MTAGPGFANTLSALFVAQAAEAPLLLLSGDSPARAAPGMFQEMPQAEMSAGVTKASWRVASANDLKSDVAKALHLAASGRPGPVHLALPADILLDQVTAPLRPSVPTVPEPHLPAAALEEILSALAAAQNPIVLLGPAALRTGVDAARQLRLISGIPYLCMESPRGINDPALGAAARLFSQADLVLLIGKRLDFTLGLSATGKLSAFSSTCRFIQVDAETAELQRSEELLSTATQALTLAVQAHPPTALRQLAAACESGGTPREKQLRSQRAQLQPWSDLVAAEIEGQRERWQRISAMPAGPRMPAQVLCSAIDEWLRDSDEEKIFISDGGEFGQWAQACVSSYDARVINGPSVTIQRISANAAVTVATSCVVLSVQLVH